MKIRLQVVGLVCNLVFRNVMMMKIMERKFIECWNWN
jgi:hypothetical protein